MGVTGWLRLFSIGCFHWRKNPNIRQWRNLTIISRNWTKMCCKHFVFLKFRELKLLAGRTHYKEYVAAFFSYWKLYLNICMFCGSKVGAKSCILCHMPVLLLLLLPPGRCSRSRIRSALASPRIFSSASAPTRSHQFKRRLNEGSQRFHNHLVGIFSVITNLRVDLRLKL